MAKYTAPVRDTQFILDNVLEIYSQSGTPCLAALSGELSEAILTGAARFAEDILQPLNKAGDREGCIRHPDGSVTTPAGFRDAYRAYVDAGWGTLSMPGEFGGQDLPFAVQLAVEEFLVGANMGFSMYQGLALGAVPMIAALGSDELKARYLPAMVSGNWGCTMNLTEPHCGSDLGLLRSRAQPLEDGSFAVTGTKIFISSGEHDLTDNIVHLVLARLPDAPSGSKGISLFLVPKFLSDGDGAAVRRNGVMCGSIEHKMGIRASATCEMQFDNAVGWLVGEAHQGLAGMFVMMNFARISVGMQGVALGEVAYQNAAAYALERRQGRAPGANGDRTKPADLLIDHPDVRRILLEARSTIEGLRALGLWTAMQVDIGNGATDSGDRKQARELLGILTPVLKAFGTDRGFATTVACQQVFGGHGYIEETGVEQFVRDARVAMIYEGANAIQALDLVSRKLQGGQTAALDSLLAKIGHEAQAAAAQDAAGTIARALLSQLAAIAEARDLIVASQSDGPEGASTAATSFLTMLGLVLTGYMWLKMALAAQARRGDDAAFHDTKQVLATYFAEHVLPEAGVHLARIKAGTGSTMALPRDAFQTDWR